jgi:hypothetical protein
MQFKRSEYGVVTPVMTDDACLTYPLLQLFMYGWWGEDGAISVLAASGCVLSVQFPGQPKISDSLSL